MFNLFNKKKSIVDLKDYEILSLAICALEEDLKYYDNYVSNFIIDYPETSKLFKKMSNTKNEFRLKLINLYKEKFSHIMNISNTNQISNFYKRKPFWLVKLNSIEEVRSEILKTENISADYFYIAAKNSKDIGCRHLLGDLAKATRDLRDKANVILAKIENTKSAQDEVVKDKRQFILTWVQPGLAGLMDGSVSTLAPIFATAFATKDSHTTLLVGLAASIGAGISMGFTEAVHDDGVISGRGSPVKRGFASGVMTTIGGLGHALPYLITDFYIATVIAMFFVIVELWAIAWIQAKYMKIKFTKAVFQVVFGGSLVLGAGILIGGG